MRLTKESLESQKTHVSATPWGYFPCDYVSGATNLPLRCKSPQEKNGPG